MEARVRVIGTEMIPFSDGLVKRKDVYSDSRLRGGSGAERRLFAPRGH
jgi:hypothetical protein